jgi:hypothetical protein
VLDDIKPERLNARLLRALVPVFANQLKPVPVQLRFDFESGRIPELLSEFTGEVDPAFLPAPDPKVQIAGLTVGVGGDHTIAEVADLAASLLLQQFAAEKPAMSGRIVIGVLVRTSQTSMGQPLLHLTRLIVPLAKLTDPQ